VLVRLDFGKPAEQRVSIGAGSFGLSMVRTREDRVRRMRDEIKAVAPVSLSIDVGRRSSRRPQRAACKHLA
jgi:hypothetical protein